MKNTGKLANLLILWVVVSTAYGQPKDRTENPLPLPIVTGDSYYYIIGGGDAIPPPASYSASVRIKARGSASFGYTCGRFDPYATIENMINNVANRIRRVPQYFIRGIEAAIAAAPGYLLNKINPRLYNVITKNMDEAFEIFDASFKSCQQMEREIRRGDNPYHRWASIALMDKWEAVIGAGAPTIDVAEETVNIDGPNEGVTLNQGVKYGGPGQPPITPLATVGESGYLAVVQGDEEQNPILKAWPELDDWLSWVERVLGTRETYILDGYSGSAQPGQGLRPELERISETLRVELRDAVENFSVADGKPVELSLSIPFAVGGPLIDELKSLPRNEREIAITALSSDLALQEVSNQEMLARQIFLTGLSDPDLRQSNGAGVAYKVIEEDAFVVLEQEIDRLYRYKMLQQMVRQTVSTLMEENMARRLPNLPAGARQINSRPMQGSGAIGK